MANRAHLLIVDDEANTLASLSRAFRLEGHEATVCDNAARALELAKAQAFDLILSDVVMPGKDGLTLLEELKAQGVPTPVVMMSGQAHIEMAVRATRLGALDFLEKPISTDKLLLTVDNALKLGRLERENRDLERRLGKHEIVWQGETMKRVMAQVEKVAASETRVCILGETGTGKELVARTAISMCACPDIITTGVGTPCAFSSSSRVRPSLPGMTTSERMRSKFCAFASSSAFAALSHTVASWPANRKARDSDASVLASSSTIKRCALSGKSSSSL